MVVGNMKEPNEIKVKIPQSFTPKTRVNIGVITYQRWGHGCWLPSRNSNLPILEQTRA